MSSWLGRQRKPELIALAERAGLDDLDGLRKDELVAVLDEHLTKNASRLRSSSVFKDYYGRTSSPVKRDSGAEPKSTRRRRATSVKEETDLSEGPSPSSPLPAVNISSPTESISHRSPGAARHAATAHISTFPPSPAVVTDAIETQTQRLSTVANEMLLATHVKSLLMHCRELLSSVVGVETMVLLLEGFSLQRRMIPQRYAFDVPASTILNTSSHAVFLPDFFVLLTDVYWSTTLLWALSNFWIPLAASWLFNLTIRPVVRHGVTVSKARMEFDPLTFNVVKALMAWLVFSKGSRIYGLFSSSTVDLVNQSMPGGYAGVLIGSFIGMLASLYDATQRK